MMQFIWFCASSDSHFLGISLMVLAVALTTLKAKPCITVSALALIGTGWTLVLMAAVALPVVFYAMWAATTIVLLVSLPTGRPAKLRVAAQATVVAFSIAALLTELDFQADFDRPGEAPLYVIGDSVSAGIQGPNEVTWPSLLASQYGIDVINLAQSGATVRSASRQAAQITDQSGVILLEIGGNDLFAPTPLQTLEADLSDLLEKVVHADRTVVMLELPVLPWQVGYTRIQRKLARQFDVILVPRRFFVAVLREPGATLDLAHLSAAGHQRMADQMAEVLGYVKSTAH